MYFFMQIFNIIIAMIVLTIPILVGVFLIKFLKKREFSNSENELLARIILLEKRVEELEDYINQSDF